MIILSGANDSEKGEFLKEAKLMWNFMHDHILSLIAICLDNDTNFLILELMEGGDLLSYLRSNRPNVVTGMSLKFSHKVCISIQSSISF